MSVAYVLLHSPLVGPSTWAPVARRLPDAVVPSFLHLQHAEPPFWPLVAEATAAAVEAMPAGTEVVLVAHSNAGRFMPVVVDALDHNVRACVFVDASLPARGGGGATPAVAPALLEVVRHKAEDGHLPPWSQWWDPADIAPMFPDAETMRRIAAEEPRLPLSFFEQSIPVPAGWDDRLCGYLGFGRDDTDDDKASDARARGWRTEHLRGRHLHQLVDPDAVARIIQEMG
ncbi:alpha/beta hydrolase [Asanoa siamensis]|uniref:alpha/beta hydrolase n=1 Tax=Asanoa siamensis TaxID=926357 RepID=UPI00194106BD|nr:alpha/beta hydrolase [Asanoa siamensis]